MATTTKKTGGAARKRTTAAKTTSRGTTARASSKDGAVTRGNTNLVIVETPAKARTIKKYLGRNFSVEASMGHVRDLPKSTLGVDVEHSFRPQYVVPRDKSKTVKDLLTSADPSQDVKGRIGVVASSHQVRRVVLTGPFFAKGEDATFTLLLSKYGETVSVTPPAG